MIFVACWSVPGPVQSILRFDPFEDKRTALGQFTVTVKLQDSVTPAVFLAVQTTVVTPLGKRLPDGGTEVRVKLVLHMPTL